VDVTPELPYERLVNPFIDGALLFLHVTVPLAEGMLGEHREDLGDAEIWDVEDVGGGLGPRGVKDHLDPGSSSPRVERPRKVVSGCHVRIEEKIHGWSSWPVSWPRIFRSSRHLVSS